MIRTAQLQDAQQIAEVHVASWRAIYRDLIPGEILSNLNVESRAKKWTTLIETAPLETIVVEQNSRIVGFANFGQDRDSRRSNCGEIRAIYLLEECWRQGLGSKLFLTAVEDLTELGFESIMIWVLEKNDNAIGFYKNHGLVLDDLRKTDAIDGYVLNEVKMSKPI